MVQLKLEVVVFQNKKEYRFNSCMVQLKFLQAIKCRCAEPGFNSCMVQLKFDRLQNDAIMLPLF